MYDLDDMEADNAVDEVPEFMKPEEPEADDVDQGPGEDKE
jgi:hypothetical protein